MNQSQRAAKQQEKKLRRIEQAMKLQRLIFLTKVDQKELDENLKKERDTLRLELWKGDDYHLRIVEVLYRGEVIYTGSRTSVARKCKKAKGTLADLLRNGKRDKQGRTYRYQDRSEAIARKADE